MAYLPRAPLPNRRRYAAAAKTDTRLLLPRFKLSIIATCDGARLLEFNVRFADPECMKVLPILEDRRVSRGEEKGFTPIPICIPQ